VTPRAFYYLNSNLMRVVGLRNKVTKQYITNTSGVTVTVELLPSVTGGSRAMTYVPGSKGVWEVVYPSDVGVTLAETYTARISASGGVFLAGRWNVELVVEERLDT